MQHHARPDKPSRLFDRGAEWDALSAFREPAAAARHARHRQWPTAHGEDVSTPGAGRAVRGFYFGATAGTEAESLRQFSAALAEHQGSPVPFSFATWDDAISYLFGLAVPGRAVSPFLVVVDEFPYLAKVAPELPSLIQRVIDRFQVEESGMRLLLCGSAMSVMGGLLASTAPLRGRAQLELVVRPFGYRAAADFWSVADDPALAARLHAVVGGTPAYRRQFLADDVPAGLGDFDDWVCRTVLSPFSPLFREARYLLAEEADHP
ncbi:AAA family ATPase [Streptomyces sp. L7]